MKRFALLFFIIIVLNNLNSADIKYDLTIYHKEKSYAIPYCFYNNDTLLCYDNKVLFFWNIKGEKKTIYTTNYDMFSLDVKNNKLIFTKMYHDLGDKILDLISKKEEDLSNLELTDLPSNVYWIDNNSEKIIFQDIQNNKTSEDDKIQVSIFNLKTKEKQVLFSDSLLYNSYNNILLIHNLQKEKKEETKGNLFLIYNLESNKKLYLKSNHEAIGGKAILFKNTSVLYTEGDHLFYLTPEIEKPIEIKIKGITKIIDLKYNFNSDLLAIIGDDKRGERYLIFCKLVLFKD